jgi:hypothetical protein
MKLRAEFCQSADAMLTIRPDRHFSCEIGTKKPLRFFVRGGDKLIGIGERSVA